MVGERGREKKRGRARDTKEVGGGSAVCKVGRILSHCITMMRGLTLKGEMAKTEGKEILQAPE